MGLSQHKLFNNSGIFGNEVDDNSHHSSLSTKRFLILDPRSPTDNIERTPIIVDKTPSATVDKVPYATVDKTPNATVGKAPNATDDETPNATVNKVPSATVDKTPSATTDQCFLSSSHYLSHTTWKTTLVVVEGVESGQHVADPRSPTPGIERTPLLLPCPQAIEDDSDGAVEENVVCKNDEPCSIAGHQPVGGCDGDGALSSQLGSQHIHSDRFVDSPIAAVHIALLPADCDVGRSRVDEESPVVVKQTHQPIPKQLFDVPLDGDSSGNTTFARPAVLRLECQPSRSPLSLISRDANTGMSSRPATKRKKVHQVDIPCDRMLTGKENIVQ